MPQDGPKTVPRPLPASHGSLFLSQDPSIHRRSQWRSPHASRRPCRHTLHTLRGPIGAPPKVQVGAARMRPRRRQPRPRYHPAEGRGRPEEGEEKEEWLLPIGVLARCAIQSGGPCPASRVSGAGCLGVWVFDFWVRVSGASGSGCLGLGVWGQGVWVRVLVWVRVWVWVSGAGCPGRGPGLGQGLGPGSCMCPMRQALALC